MRKVSNYVIDDRELDELWAPFEALKGVFDVGHLPRKRMIQANDSLLADLLGENPKAPPRSELSSRDFGSDLRNSTNLQPDKPV